MKYKIGGGLAVVAIILYFVFSGGDKEMDENENESFSKYRNSPKEKKVLTDSDKKDLEEFDTEEEDELKEDQTTKSANLPNTEVEDTKERTAETFEDDFDPEDYAEPVDKEDFAEFLDSALDELPESEENALAVVGEIGKIIQVQSQLEEEAINFFQKCSEHAKLAPSVREACREQVAKRGY